jgi:hypothetical protein
MKVKALQGDTVDLLCQRHYGRTRASLRCVISKHGDCQPDVSDRRPGDRATRCKRGNGRRDRAVMELINQR